MLTSTGVYPVAMVGLGTGDTNVTPTTAAILLLALVHWSLPIAAVLGAALLGALPRQHGGRGRRRA